MVDKYHNGARHLEKRLKVLLFLSLGKFGRKEMTEASTTSLINIVKSESAGWVAAGAKPLAIF
jgi:hypothetical protein